jgi:Ca2+-binding EF-hand superfamily protein
MWNKTASNGKISRKEFSEGLKAVGIKDDLQIEQYFTAFDSNKDGTIEFREFVTGLSVVQRGSVDEKLKCKSFYFMKTNNLKVIFSTYDKDGSGTLSPKEMYSLLKATHLSRGTQYQSDDLAEVVSKTFQEADSDQDGSISYEEFREAVLNKKIVVDHFVNISSSK